MKKRKIMIASLVGIVIIVSAFMVLYFVVTGKTTPHNSHSQDVDIKINGNIYQIPEIESEICEIINEVETRKIKTIKLNNVEYSFNSDETGNVYFSFYIDNSDEGYSYFWKKIFSQDLEGLAELWVSIPDAKVYRIAYNYGVMEGKVDNEDLSERNDINIWDYYQTLIKDSKYLESVNNDPNVIKIRLRHDKIEATSYSIDGSRILYNFQ